MEKGIKMAVTEEHVKANLKSFDGKKVEDSHWANQWWPKRCDSVVCPIILITRKEYFIDTNNGLLQSSIYLTLKVA